MIMVYESEREQSYRHCRMIMTSRRVETYPFGNLPSLHAYLPAILYRFLCIFDLENSAIRTECPARIVVLHELI
jgi:hypothetical protein